MLPSPCGIILLRKIASHSTGQGCPLRYQLVMFFAVPPSSSWQLPVFCSLASRSFMAKLQNPYVAVLGSPASRFGLKVCHLFCMHTHKPEQNKKVAKLQL